MKVIRKLLLCYMLWFISVLRAGTDQAKYQEVDSVGAE
jgi:hypothetical protein